jgi:hypothetical protein
MNPLHFYMCRHLKTLVWQRRGTPPSHCGCLSDYPQLLRHLWTEAGVHKEKSRGVHWISWRWHLPGGTEKMREHP